MNQIIIRTHKCAYEPGEEIFGVVYLNIVNPTAGTGVCVRFEGYEHFIYNSGLRDDPDYLVKKQYIDCPFDLYQSQDNLGIGSYVFPFRFQLLSDLPGSFKASSPGNEKWWKSRIQYWISAELIHANSVKVTQDVIVYPCLPSTVSVTGPTQNYIKTIDIANIPIITRKLTLTARLFDHVHISGGVAKLRIIITNNTKRNVKKIYIKLYGYFAFLTKGPKQNVKDPCVTEDGDDVIIQPTDNPQLIWESRPIEGCATEILNTGIDNVHIPLLTQEGNPLPPTVNSKYHIKCTYEIEITVELENEKMKATLMLPLHCVRHIENEAWLKWQAPHWVYDTEILTSNSQFSVPENVLNGPAFSEIPRFQLLS